VLQVSLEDPEQTDPPFAGVGFVQVLVWLPEPQDLLQLVQEVQPPFTGHSCVLQVSVGDPEQSDPPFAGDGFVHVLVCLPEPQDLLQLVQEVQPPLTVLVSPQLLSPDVIYGL